MKPKAGPDGLHEIGLWWSAGGQTQVGENLDDHGGIFNGRDERQGATTVGTGGHVDLEHPFE